MSDLVLYTNPQSRGQIAHWMLEELGEPYETQWIEYGEQMKGDEYLAINPMGKVPAISHRGKVVTECPAICAYLAAVFPDKQLMPEADDPRLADYFRWLFFGAGPLEQAITFNSMNLEAPEGSNRTLGFGTYAETLDALQLALQKGPFICGELFTAADVYVGSHIYWGLQFGTMEKRPLFEEYGNRLTQRRALQAMQQINQQRIEATAE